MIWHTESSAVILIVYVKKDVAIESFCFSFPLRTGNIAGSLVSTLCLPGTTEVKMQMWKTVNINLHPEKH